MGRPPCCEKNGVKKGPWAPEEDQKLTDYIQKNGYGNWRTLPKNAGLQRCGKSCRLRWTNYLRPDIKRGRFSFEEEEAIIQLHSILGNKWSAIAARLPGRTDNEIKNYWNTHIKKKLLRMGIDPVTHTPRLDLLNFSTVPNSSLYRNSLFRLSGIQSLINPELLRLASSHFSSKPQNQDYLFPNRLLTNDNTGSFQTCQMQNPVQDLTIPTTCLDTTSTQLQDQGQYDAVQHFPKNLAGFGSENYGCYGSDQPVIDPTPLLETSNLKSVLSSLSTPASSPTLYSNPTYNASSSSSTEDDRENNYGSNMLQFEIPDFWDVNNIM